MSKSKKYYNPQELLDKYEDRFRDDDRPEWDLTQDHKPYDPKKDREVAKRTREAMVKRGLISGESTL